MPEFITYIQEKVIPNLIDNVFNWIITALITFISVRLATRQYYNKYKVKLVQDIMEQGLRSLLKLKYNEELPVTVKVIFVEYKGRCYKKGPKNKTEKDCSLGMKIRRTVASAGGDTRNVSTHRPRDYGVLGVANALREIVVFNFKNGELYKYSNDEIVKLETKKRRNKFYYVEGKNEKELSDVKTDRDTMIAIPILIKNKVVGGVTFDMEIGSKTVYQHIEKNDSEETRKEKEENNRQVFKIVRRTADILIKAYFSKKGEEK